MMGELVNLCKKSFYWIFITKSRITARESLFSQFWIVVFTTTLARGSRNNLGTCQIFSFYKSHFIFLLF